MNEQEKSPEQPLSQSILKILCLSVATFIEILVIALQSTFLVP
jgi:hypothetical protein